MNQSTIKDRKYDFAVQFYTQAKEIELDKKCNGFTVVNVGLTLATVDNFPINPTLVPGSNGEVFAIAGNANEVFRFRQVTIAFPNGNGRVAVIQKYFTE